ncbi:hypothetical protein NIES4105_05850 [Calothrix sp. NIES-4105]|nr:hypothetical protein NIES4105_05850 [Calothrix sp. NIES-4105]
MGVFFPTSFCKSCPAFIAKSNPSIWEALSNSCKALFPCRSRTVAVFPSVISFWAYQPAPITAVIATAKNPVPNRIWRLDLCCALLNVSLAWLNIRLSSSLTAKASINSLFSNSPEAAKYLESSLLKLFSLAHRKASCKACPRNSRDSSW